MNEIVKQVTDRPKVMRITFHPFCKPGPGQNFCEILKTFKGFNEKRLEEVREREMARVGQGG